MENSILNVKVSCFKNYGSPHNPVTIDLKSWLTSEKYKAGVMELRAVDDKKIRDKMKSQLPLITPSGIFSYRSEANLLKHSGFIAIDIDRDNINSKITNWKNLKKEICKISNVAYFGLSVSGKGYWGLVPINTPEAHKDHFRALKFAFIQLGINLDDAPCNVASARGYSYDSEAYFNHSAIMFTGRLKEVKPSPIVTQQISLTHGHNIKLLEWLIKEMNGAAEGELHGTRIKYGRLCGGYIAGGLLEEGAAQILVDSYISAYGMADGGHIQKKEIKAITDGIAYGINEPIYELVNLKPVKPTISNLQERKASDAEKQMVEVKNIERIEATCSINKSKETKAETEWNIAELELFFKSTSLPSQSIKLNQCSTIPDVSKFIESHLATLKSNDGNRTFQSYFDRLEELRRYLVNNSI